jgi:hypothetical protein
MSLREKLLPTGSLREKLAGIALTGAGAVTRSTELTSKGIQMATGTASKPQKSEEEIKQNTAAQELETQRSINRQSGYDSDPSGNRASRLNFKERVTIANEFPGAIGGDLFDDNERKMIDIKEEPDQGFIDKVKRVVNNEPVKKTVTVKPGYETVGDEIKIIAQATPKDNELKKVPSFYPDDVKKDFVVAAKENNYDISRLSAQMESEMGWYEPGYVKKDEGAIGQGQHRDIFFKEWNPKFKEKYGHDYDRTNPRDVFRATSLAMSEYTQRYGSWEAALIAYNKGPSVVQDYIDDPNYEFDDDPYVQGVKEKLKKYSE